MNATTRARSFRRSAPLSERKVWDLLRDRRLAGLKFRRQVPLGPYVVDFACLRHRVIVEADGPFHDPAKDALRDQWLVSQGFRVLRFENRELSAHEVIARILRLVEAPLADGELGATPHPAPDQVRGHLLPHGEKVDGGAF